MHLHQTFLAALLPTMAAALAAPALSGMHVTWQDSFYGGQGTAPNTTAWNIVTGNLGVNGELETYSDSSQNLQISGGGTVQLVPWRSSSGAWTSARIESKASWTPQPGKVTRVDGSLRLGSNSAANKQGIWPAFWMLGDAMRTGTPWPLCGELDILEQVNGIPTGHGTAHCSQMPGGVCNEPAGRSGSVAMAADNDFHLWSLEWDRTSNYWQSESIVYSYDGEPYFSLCGSDIGDEGTWSVLAHSPFYIILNVAVGGGWPGDPNSSTLDGYGSMMEVAYVAVYSN